MLARRLSGVALHRLVVLGGIRCYRPVDQSGHEIQRGPLHPPRPGQPPQFHHQPVDVPHGAQYHAPAAASTPAPAPAAVPGGHVQGAGPVSSPPANPEEGDANEGDEAEEMEEMEEGEEMDLPPPKPEAPPEVKVTVKNHLGQHVPVQPIKLFQHLEEDLPPWLAAGIRKSGYAAPMPVQATAIPLLMEQRDVIGIAPTGSGKTVAFAIPALAGLDSSKSFRGRGCAHPLVLVLCPTRELVQQTHKVFVGLSSGGPIIQAVFGGGDREQQANLIRSRGADVIVAAPGRLCDFLENDVVSLDRVSFLVLDEADRMLEMGFAPQLSLIMSKMQKDVPRITMMWSATWSDTVGGLAKNFLNPQRLTINVEGDGNKANKNIDQRVYCIRDESDRLRQLTALYSDNTITMNQKVIIFAKRKNEINELMVQVARALGFPEDRVQGLHGDLKQGKRSAIIRKFREGYIRVLVATDIAARGLDVPEIDHVVNFDLPLHIDSYVHRIGRTGRAGRKGMAHTLICERDSSAIVADLGEYYQKNKVSFPSNLERVFIYANNRNQFRRERYRSHASYSAEFWRTRGKDPNSPRSPRHGGGGGGGGGGFSSRPAPRIVSRS